MREALFVKAQSDLHELTSTCATKEDWAALVRTAGLHLGRILDICAEIRHLACRVPVSAEALPNGSVAVTAVYSFFTSRTRFAVHLLFESADPNEPIAWQFTEDTRRRAAAVGRARRVVDGARRGGSAGA